jgi:P27 family predicted phage terminase small subunit
VGKRGPAPKPAELRAGAGVAPVVLSDVLPALAAPDHLEPEAVQVWDELVPPLIDSGVVQDADRLAVEALVNAVAQMRAANAVLADEGMFVKSPNGYQIAHPAVAIANKAAAEFRAWASRFGLTPSDRVALGLQVVRGRTAGAQWADALGENPRSAGD